MKIEEYIEMLNNMSATEIADMLKRKGFVGIPDDRDHCPLAEDIKRTCNLENAEVDGLQVKVIHKNGIKVVFCLDNDVRDFVFQFDDLIYEELVDPDFLREIKEVLEELKTDSF